MENDKVESLNVSLAWRTVMRMGMQIVVGHSFCASMHSVSSKRVSLSVGLTVSETIPF